jgi:dTDP-4-amino-4,6-dideoxygalactose transaminase
MKIRFVDLPRQSKILKKELLKGIEKVVVEANFIEGKPLEDFEKAFARFVDKKFAVGLNSGTDALKLALLAYGIKAGDEVITVSNSYFSTAMVISEIGAKPVFVDANPETYNIDVSKLEPAINKKTKAIIPVHLYGQSADMDPIIKIAKKHNLIIIEDVCQAHGAKYKGKILPYTETGAFSFYPGKNLGAFGDAGAIVTDNPKIYEKLLYLRNDGSRKKYIHNFLVLRAGLILYKLKFY